MNSRKNNQLYKNEIALEKENEFEMYAFMKWLNRGRIFSDKGFGERPLQIDFRIEDLVSYLKEYNEINSINDFQMLLTKEQNHLKVLVIDDEESVIKSIGRVFVNFGYQVISTGDGFKAGWLLNKERPHVITLDLSMNVMSGFDILKLIKEIKLNNKVWIVVISGGQEQNLERAVHLGADFILRKPFDKSDLEKIINKIKPECEL